MNQKIRGFDVVEQGRGNEVDHVLQELLHDGLAVQLKEKNGHHEAAHLFLRSEGAIVSFVGECGEQSSSIVECEDIVCQGNWVTWAGRKKMFVGCESVVIANAVKEIIAALQLVAELDEDADDHKSSSSINSGSSREQSTTPPRSLEPAINSTRRLSALERGRRLPSGEWKHHKRRDEADFLLCGMNRNEHRRMTLIFGVSSILPI